VFRRLTPRSAAFNARNDASGDICRICSRHRSTPKFESMRQTRSSTGPWEI
jgi:hypothetical protein